MYDKDKYDPNNTDTWPTVAELPMLQAGAQVKGILEKHPRPWSIDKIDLPAYPIARYYALDYVGEIFDANGVGVDLGIRTLSLETACLLVDAVNAQGGDA